MGNLAVERHQQLYLEQDRLLLGQRQAISQELVLTLLFCSATCDATIWDHAPVLRLKWLGEHLFHQPGNKFIRQDVATLRQLAGIDVLQQDPHVEGPTYHVSNPAGTRRREIAPPTFGNSTGLDLGGTVLMDGGWVQMLEFVSILIHDIISY